jgi:hypothetical protein
MKIRLPGAELFHADGQTQTDMTRVMVAFHNFVNTSKQGNGENFIMRNFMRQYLQPMALEWPKGYDKTEGASSSYLKDDKWFHRTQNRFILIQILHLHVCYVFRPVLRQSSGMSMPNLIKEDIIMSKRPLV